MNLVCVPRGSRGDLIETFEKRGMVKVNIKGGKYYLGDYVLNWKGDNIKIEQLGNMESCKR